jgi:hypothetical protein
VDPRESPELAPRAPFHWGGVLVQRHLFEEDDDLLVKLGARAALIRAWLFARTLACLHFEHPRRYDGPGLTANRARYGWRAAAGAEAMIAEDRARNGP